MRSGAHRELGFLHKQKSRTPYILIAPLVIAISLFLVYPTLYAIFLSFTSMTIPRMDLPLQFVGFRNYIDVVTDRHFFAIFKQTIYYVLLMVSGTYVLSLFVAGLLYLKPKGDKVFRVLLLIPWGIPVVAAGLIWNFMLNPQLGVVNYLLERLNLINFPIGWLNSPSTALITVVAIRWWLTMPFATMMLLGGLQSISTDIIESAKVDGATGYKLFWHIIRPSLRSVSSTLILLSTIWAIKDFDTIYVLTQGGPVRSTTVLALDAYISAFSRLNYGRATATGTIALLFSVIFSVIYTRRFVHQD